jgi:hypothetical protein
VRLSFLWTGFTVASKVLNDIIADEENLAMVRVVSRDQLLVCTARILREDMILAFRKERAGSK